MIVLSHCWLRYAVSCVYLNRCVSDSLAGPRSGDICLLNLILVSVFALLASFVSRVLQDKWDCESGGMEEVCGYRSSPSLSENFQWLSQLSYSCKCWKMLKMLHTCSPRFFKASWHVSRQFAPWHLLWKVCFMYYSFYFLEVQFSYDFSVSSLYFSPRLWNNTLIRTSSLT